MFDEIASGGMASVFLGRLVGPVGFSRIVAIKRPHRHLLEDRNAVSMFIDEARLASRVQHPNVIGAHDIVVDGDEVLLVMDYVHGKSLSWLARTERAQHRTTPVAIATALATSVLYGLHAAHEATSERGLPLGLIHRDVSPQNILVGADGVPRVVDFGIAKAAERLQTTTEGQLKGKAAYLAPEQINGAHVDRRADVYAAAVVLWELLAGRRMFDDGNAFDTLRQVLEVTHAPPSRYQATVPASVDAVVLRALAADPDQRFATARDMAIALERATHVASTREISEWVETLAGDELHAHARRIAEIESMSTPVFDSFVLPGHARDAGSAQDDIATAHDSPLARASAAASAVSATPRRRIWLVAALGTLAIGVAAAALWWRTAPAVPAQDPPEMAAPPHAAPRTPGPAAQAVQPAAPAPPTLAASAPRESPQPARPKASRVRARATRATSATSKSKRDARCAIPFEIGRDGTKIPKAECL